MHKWEYQTVTISRRRKPLGGLTEWEPKIDLVKFGESGWELVSVVPLAGDQGSGSGMTTQLVYYFKRTNEMVN